MKEQRLFLFALLLPLLTSAQTKEVIDDICIADYSGRQRVENV